MKNASITLISIVVLLPLFWQFKTPETDAILPEEITMCASPGRIPQPGNDDKFIRALKGWGNVHCVVSTTKDSVQFYFDQGLSFYFGYHFTEALASFKEAGRLDPTCAMAYWGQALAMGPFYNTYVYKMKSEVPEAVAAMSQRITGVSPKEKLLIEALKKRYSDDLTNADRQKLDRAYALALADLENKFPDDDNITALYIDAVMLEHKWDFWDQQGNPRPWTPELVEKCERVLKHAQHPAILHYYIHLTEASRQPDKALAAADELKDQIPGIGHMVHMASHMYQRNGLFEKGITINEEANAVNNTVDAAVPSLGLGRDRSPHFFAVQSYCAMTAGIYRDGQRMYQRARDRQVAFNSNLSRDLYGQFVYMVPVMAHVRLGRWDEILRSTDVDPQWKYAVVLDNFAKGIASLRKNNLQAATKYLQKIEATMQDESLAQRLMPFNSPLQSCRIAKSILEGEIQFANKKYDAAVKSFEAAVLEEDNMVYREPQDWLIPARQFLGARLLTLKRTKEAEKIYREDLIVHPGNGWSLLGLYQSLLAQKNTNEAALYKEKYQKAFASSDLTITTSAF
jgi:tetratricopeptide (TPR) repeat protein